MKGTNFQIEKAPGLSTTMNEKRPIASSIIMKFQNTREQKIIKSFQSEINLTQRNPTGSQKPIKTYVQNSQKMIFNLEFHIQKTDKQV